MAQPIPEGGGGSAAQTRLPTLENPPGKLYMHFTWGLNAFKRVECMMKNQSSPRTLVFVSASQLSTALPPFLPMVRSLVFVILFAVAMGQPDDPPPGMPPGMTADMFNAKR